MTEQQSKTLIEEMYTSLQRRFGRMPRQPEPIVYEFTDDRALLHQYYRIRETMYRKIHHVDQFSGAEDVYDKISHILIARRGKLCIGGCRLIVREGDEEFLLPMEEGNFKLRDTLPRLPLSKLRHCEISRFAVMDDDENYMEIMLALSQLVIDKCNGLGVAYVFIKSPGLPMARNWRKIARAHCGLTAKICTDIAIPTDAEYPEIDWQMVQIDLPASQITPPAEEDLYTMPVESPASVH